MRKIERDFSCVINQIFPKNFPSKIAVAVSGGVDSMVLLGLIKNVLGKKTKIFCICVDHKMRANSKSDAQFVSDYCQKNKIYCEVLESYLESIPDVDIENSLREVRYNLFEKFCEKHQIKHLFLAHHKQDIAENFLIRLFRGSGIDGLAAINKIRDFSSDNKKIKVIRPLLEFSKEDLKTYANSENIDWREDESNENEKFLRNKIRKFLKSFPESRVVENRINLAAKAILEAKNIIDKKTKREFPKIFKLQKDRSFDLDVEKFKKLEESIATRYLALCLIKVSKRNYKPRLKKLMRVYNLIIENMLKSEEFYGCVLRKNCNNNINITKK